MSSRNDPVGDWDGTFTIDNGNPEYGVGIYTHLRDGACGTHEYIINRKKGAVTLHGECKSEPDKYKKFSLTIEKKT